LVGRTAATLACLAAVSLAGCTSERRQDKNEPEGRYRLQVLDATFPTRQKLAQRSDLVIKVRNADNKVVPNIGVTVDGFNKRVDDPDLADPNRPIFVINGRPKDIGGFPESQEAAPEGGDTAYVNTWALGRLKPGQRKTFRWSVTAVKAGPYKIKYRVNAGLDGKAKAVDARGRLPRGQFAGTISDKPPDARVAEDGQTVVSGTR
jgi:hypothetical protein